MLQLGIILPYNTRMCIILHFHDQVTFTGHSMKKQCFDLLQQLCQIAIHCMPLSKACNHLRGSLFSLLMYKTLT